MKSLNCWFKSKDDKSMFQERIPVREKERERSVGVELGEYLQAHRRDKNRERIRTAMMSLSDVFKKGG